MARSRGSSADKEEVSAGVFLSNQESVVVRNGRNANAFGESGQVNMSGMSSDGRHSGIPGTQSPPLSDNMVGAWGS